MTDPSHEPAAQSPAPAPARRPGDAVVAVFRTALRSMLVLLAVLLVVGGAVGALVAGVAGLWGALLGVAVALLFSGVTIGAMLLTANAPPTQTAAVVLGSWLAKIVVLVILLAVLRGLDFYDRPTFAIVLLLGVIGGALLDYRAVQRGRVSYVEPVERPRRPADGTGA